jgi:hypothetical protein
MELTLSDEEAVVLRDLLADYLPQLKMEVARTEVTDMRHQLAERREMCERLLGLLDRVLKASHLA